MEMIRVGNTALWAGSLKTSPHVLKKLLGKSFLILPSFESSLSATVVSVLLSLGTDPANASLVVKQKHQLLCRKTFTKGSCG